MLHMSWSLLVLAPPTPPLSVSPGPSLDRRCYRRSMGSVVIFNDIRHAWGAFFWGDLSSDVFPFGRKTNTSTVETKPRNDSVCTVGQVHSAGPTQVQRTSECHHRNQKDSSPDGRTSRHPSRGQRSQGCRRCGKARSCDPVTVARRTRRLRRRRAPIPQVDRRGGTGIPRGLKAKQWRRLLRVLGKLKSINRRGNMGKWKYFIEESMLFV